MLKCIFLILFFLIIAFGFVKLQYSSALTQFFYAIPTQFENTTGMVFSVDVNNKNYSWMDNGEELVSFNSNTPDTNADDTDLDLDANEYLFAIDEKIDKGTRVYMCLFTNLYMTEPQCQTDAVDLNDLARANFKYIK
jgi:hypothetical protein